LECYARLVTTALDRPGPLAFGRDGLCFTASVRAERTADIVLRICEVALCVPPDVTLVTFVRLDEFPLAGHVSASHIREQLCSIPATASLCEAARDHETFPGRRAGEDYEKDASKHTLASIHATDPRQAGGKAIRYICVDDLATVVSCANMAGIRDAFSVQNGVHGS
jgi:hypothetical protein